MEQEIFTVEVEYNRTTITIEIRTTGAEGPEATPIGGTLNITHKFNICNTHKSVLHVKCF
jgi:hypothetical protein